MIESYAFPLDSRGLLCPWSLLLAARRRLSRTCLSSRPASKRRSASEETRLARRDHRAIATGRTGSGCCASVSIMDASMERAGVRSTMTPFGALPRPGRADLPGAPLREKSSTASLATHAAASPIRPRAFDAGTRWLRRPRTPPRRPRASLRPNDQKSTRRCRTLRTSPPPTAGSPPCLSPPEESRTESSYRTYRISAYPAVYVREPTSTSTGESISGCNPDPRPRHAAQPFARHRKSVGNSRTGYAASSRPSLRGSPSSER